MRNRFYWFYRFYISTEKDLGVIIDVDLSFQSHINNICKKAYFLINSLLKSFLSANYGLIVRAYKVYIQPILDNASVISSPHHDCRIIQLERIQKRFVKKLGPNFPSYTARLNFLRMHPIALRRIKLDLVYFYKILHKNVDFRFALPAPSVATRGHSQKFLIPAVSSDMRKHFFLRRVLPVWNSLDESVIQAPSPASFSYTLEHHSRFADLL